MLFFAVRASLKPADEEHTYGHEKFEAIGGLIGGIVLIAVACIIFYEAALRLIAPTATLWGHRIRRFCSYSICTFYSLIKSDSL